jgi:Tfp pilus assembly protein PilV
VDWTRGGLCTRRRAGAARSRAHNERGVTLIEVQITVLVLGLVATAFCGSLFMATKTATQTETSAAADTELRKYAELVRSVEYEPCSNPTTGTEPPAQADTSSYRWSSTDAPANTVGWVQNIEFGTPNIANKQELKIDWTSRAASTCNGVTDQADAQTKDPGLQRITIAVRVSGTTPVTTTATIIKRTPNGAT